MDEFVKFVTSDEISHVACVITGTLINNRFRYKKYGKKYVIEYPGLATKDGVMIMSFNQYIKKTNSKKLVWRIIKNVDRISESNIKECENFINYILKTNPPYERNIFDFIYSVIGPVSSKYENGKYYYCIEFVNAIYKCLGLLPKEISSNSYLPKHYYDTSAIATYKQNALKLTNDSDFFKNKECIFKYPFELSTYSIIN